MSVRNKTLLLWGGGFAIMLLLPLAFHQGYAITLLSQMGIAIIFALSYNMLLGQGGMLSFGHAVYFGLGAYFAIHLLRLIAAGKFVLPVMLLPLAGGLAGLVFGVIFGYVTTKRAGTTFAMISLGIAELVAACSLMFPGFFGGEAGVSSNRMAGPAVFGITLGPPIQVYYLIAVWAFLCMALMYAFTQTPLGRMMNAVRDNPERAAFVGYNPQRVRFFTLVIAAGFAGIAGGLSAITYEIVTAETVGLVPSGNVLLMTLIGGVRQFFGPIVGAVLVTFLQVALSGYTKAWQLYIGILFLVMVMFAPGGISSLIMLHRPLWNAGLLPRLLSVYAAALATFLILFAGVVVGVEMTYSLSTLADPNKVLTIFGQAVDAHAALPWFISAALVAIGGFLFALACRAVGHKWAELTPLLKAATAS